MCNKLCNFQIYNIIGYKYDWPYSNKLINSRREECDTETSHWHCIAYLQKLVDEIFLEKSTKLLLSMKNAIIYNLRIAHGLQRHNKTISSRLCAHIKKGQHYSAWLMLSNNWTENHCFSIFFKVNIFYATSFVEFLE